MLEPGGDWLGLFGSACFDSAMPGKAGGKRGGRAAELQSEARGVGII